MPVLLTTAFDPGDLDSGHTYLRATITDYAVLLRNGSPCIIVNYTFGNVVDDQWVRGNAAPSRSATIIGADYDSMIEEAAIEGESYNLYQGVKRVLYNYLIDHDYLVGTIE